MKRKLLALSLGFSMLGCQQTVPVNTAPAPATNTAARSVASEPAPLTGQMQAHKNPDGSYRLQLQVSLANDFRTQALNCNTDDTVGPESEIKKLKITLYGPGVSPMSPPSPYADGDGNVEAMACGIPSTVSFSDVPEGSRRLIRIEGLREDNSKVPGAEIQSAFSLANEGSPSVTVDFRSTPAAKALENLLVNNTIPAQRGVHLAGKADLAKLQDFIDVLIDWDGSAFALHPSFVNAEAISEWLISQPEDLSADELNAALQALIDDPSSHNAYLLNTGSISGTIIGARTGQDILVRYNDPGSPVQNIISSSITSSEVSFNISPTVASGSYLLEAMQGAEPYRRGYSSSASPGPGHLLYMAEPLSNNWSITGQPTGGKITALVRYDANKLYAGLENGGVYKYEDSNWSRIPGLLHGEQVKALAVDPGSNKVYAATNTGIYVSISDGDWMQVYNSSTHSGIVINDLLVDPQDTADVYAATSLGLLRSDNGGDFVLLNTAPVDGANLLRIVKYVPLPPVPSSDARFFAMGAPGNNRIYRSVDGLSWEIFYAEGSHELIDIAADASTVLAIASSESGTPFIRYTNNLLAGAPISSLIDYGAADFATSFPGAAPTRLHFDTGILYVATKNQVVKYAPGPSNSWVNADTGTPPINQPHVTSLAGGLPDLLAGTMGGGVSQMSSSTTTPINTGLSGQYITALARHPAHENVLAAATRGGGIFISTDNGDNWEVRHEGLYNDPRERDVTSLAFDANGHLYAGTAGAGVHVLNNPKDCNSASGSQWHNMNLTLSAAKIQSLAAVDGRIFAGVAEEGPLVDKGLYSNMQADFGSVPICTDPLMPPGGWSNAISNQNIYSLAVKPGGNAGGWTLLAGSSGGQIYRSTDSGSSWSAAISTGLSQPVLAIGVSPDIPEYIYAIAHQPQGVVASTNSGVSWSDVGQDLPTDTEARPKSLTVFRRNANRVMIGMENGQIYYSESARIANSPWNDLPPEDVRQPITALLASDDGASGYVFAGTLGRSVLRMSLGF
ncbi:MAG: hypothetical protein IGS03_00310 [Candidatus Sericytochromatia bacterium]|nr:hypothetical protein [Candidatus Sericytochromatia bacterium]